MGMTVKRRRDASLASVMMHKVADIRGGVSVAVSELGGDWLSEGAVLSAPVNGICHVVKYAEVVAEVAAAGKAINVAKGHNFKAGDFVMSATGGKAYAITSVTASNKEYDVINIGTAIGAVSKGAFLMEAKAESADTGSALKYAPCAVVGTGKPVQAGQNVDTDAWVIAVTKGNRMPEEIAKGLKGIINID